MRVELGALSYKPSRIAALGALTFSTFSVCFSVEFELTEKKNAVSMTINESAMANTFFRRRGALFFSEPAFSGSRLSGF